MPTPSLDWIAFDAAKQVQAEARRPERVQGIIRDALEKAQPPALTTAHVAALLHIARWYRDEQQCETARALVAAIEAYL